METLLEALGPRQLFGTKTEGYCNHSATAFHSCLPFFAYCSLEQEWRFYLTLVRVPQCILWNSLKFSWQEDAAARWWMWKASQCANGRFFIETERVPLYLSLNCEDLKIDAHWCSFGRASRRMPLLKSLLFSHLGAFVVRKFRPCLGVVVDFPIQTHECRILIPDTESIDTSFFDASLQTVFLLRDIIAAWNHSWVDLYVFPRSRRKSRLHALIQQLNTFSNFGMTHYWIYGPCISFHCDRQIIGQIGSETLSFRKLLHRSLLLVLISFGCWFG